MRAIIQAGYGDPSQLRLDTIPTPSCGPGEVLVRIHGAAINPADWYAITGSPFPVRLALGLFRPRNPVPGRDMAGVVEAVGEGVCGFVPGDEVFGEIDGGAFAEFALTRPKRIALRPQNAGPTPLEFADCAALPLAGMTALQGVRDVGALQPGQRLLVNGASGGVGSYAVQIGKLLGAEVTAVCSARNAERVRALGADHVLDYAVDDFCARSACFDVVFDSIGNRTIAELRHALTPTGVFVSSSPHLGFMLRVGFAGLFGSQRFRVLAASCKPADLAQLRTWVESGELRPLLDQRYSLIEVPEAIAAQGAGHRRGKSVVSIA